MRHASRFRSRTRPSSWLLPSNSLPVETRSIAMRAEKGDQALIAPLKNDAYA
jgi:hypothetical protein